jgi:cholesterol transport system auxiliary component
MTEVIDPKSWPKLWHRRRIVALAAGLPLLATGCLGSVAPAPRRFRLANPTSIPADLPAVDWALEVDQTVADPGIDTTLIARTASNGLELEYYADAEWPTKASDLVNTLLVQSFVDSGKIPRVGDRNSGLRPDFSLKTVLRDFQSDGAATPSIKVTMTASLIQLPRRLQAGAERFQRVVPAASGSIEDVVRAFDQALGGVLTSLVIWTVKTGADNRPAG